MIDVVISPQCQEIMNLLEIDRDMLVTTVNDRHCGLVDPGLTRIVAVHWFTETQIVFVDTTVTKRDIDKTNNSVHFREVTANIVLDLRPQLPACRITREMEMEEILNIVAISFGQPVTCHIEHPPATLYSGPWDGHTIDVRIDTAATIGVCGSFLPDEHSASLVWALNLERYREWFVHSQSGK